MPTPQWVVPAITVLGWLAALCCAVWATGLKADLRHAKELAEQHKAQAQYWYDLANEARATIERTSASLKALNTKRAESQKAAFREAL